MNKTMDLEFEAWARKMSMDLEYRNIPGVGQFYECPRTLLALEAWQASRAAIEVRLPSPYSIFNNQFEISAAESFEHYARASIEALGLKVRP